MGVATGSRVGLNVGRRIYPCRLGLWCGRLGRVCYCLEYVCRKHVSVECFVQVTQRNCLCANTLHKTLKVVRKSPPDAREGGQIFRFGVRMVTFI